MRTLTLPSADATVEFWTKGFNFRHMAADQLQTARESLRLMVFPGTDMLYKVLLPQEEPFLVAKPDKAKTNAVIAGSKTNELPAGGTGDTAEEGRPCFLKCFRASRVLSCVVRRRADGCLNGAGHEERQEVLHDEISTRL